jgi:hypothetical protein
VFEAVDAAMDEVVSMEAAVARSGRSCRPTSLARPFSADAGAGRPRRPGAWRATASGAA